MTNNLPKPEVSFTINLYYVYIKKRKNFAERNSVWKEERKKRSFFDTKTVLFTVLHMFAFCRRFFARQNLTSKFCLRRNFYAIFRNKGKQSNFGPEIFLRRFSIVLKEI